VLVDAPKDFQFSLSHDGEWAMLVAGRGEEIAIGCDIVQTTRETRIERLPRTFTDEEWEQVRGAGSPVDDNLQRLRLLKRWAVKEAVVKALGIGIKFGMDNVRVNLDGEPGHLNDEFLKVSSSLDRLPRKRVRTTLKRFLEGEATQNSAVDQIDFKEDENMPCSITAEVKLLRPCPEETLELQAEPTGWKVEMGHLDDSHLWVSAVGFVLKNGSGSEELELNSNEDREHPVNSGPALDVLSIEHLMNI